MNDTNPFIPQGSILEQKNKKRARVKVAVLAIFGVNLVLIGALLTIPACKRGDQAQNDSDTNTTPADTGIATTSSNLPPAALTSNLIATAMASNTPAPVQPPVAQILPVTADATEYVVLPHDTYISIAKKFPGLTYKAIEAANPDVPPTKLMPGKKIKIPPSTGPMAVAGGASDSDNTYTVKSGETLTKIAHNFNTTVPALQELNGLKTTSIKAGQKLKVPAKAATTTADSTPGAAAATTTASNPMPAPAPTIR